MATFLECFDIILTGDKQASQKAARQVRKLVYGSGERESFKLIASIMENASKEYAKIKEDCGEDYMSRLADFYHKKYFSNFNRKYENTN